MNNCPALLVGLDELSCQSLSNAIKRVNPFLPLHTILMDEGEERLELAVTRESPRLIFLCTDDMEKALPALSLLRSSDRSALIVAFSHKADNEALLNLMRFGVREWLQVPVDDIHLHHCVERLKEELAYIPAPAKNLGDLVSFFPAKPGSGASTLMMHSALSITASSDIQIALLDMDLNCGVQGFLWKADGGASIQEAVQNAERMDDPLWERIVLHRDRLHILVSGALNPGLRLEVPQLHRLLGFVERRYRLAFLDHSGNWERYSIDALQRSSAIFQVCTTDFASLHHARRNREAFQEMGLGDRVHIILNRASYHCGLDHRSVVSILGAEPIASIPNAFYLLQESIKDVAAPKRGTAFGDAVASLSQAIQKLVSAELPVREAAGAVRRSPWSLGVLRSMLSGLRAHESPVEVGEQ